MSVSALSLSMINVTHAATTSSIDAICTAEYSGHCPVDWEYDQKAEECIKPVGSIKHALHLKSPMQTRLVC